MFAWRALYLRIYAGLALVLSLWSLLHLFQGDWGWLGALLAWGHLPCINYWRRYHSNFAFRDERERLAMTSTMLGVALVLIAGSRDWALAATLGGLFGLLIYVFIASALPRGLREEEGETGSLAGLTLSDGDRERTLSELNTDKPVLLLVMHSASHCYSRMAARELQIMLSDGQLPLSAEQCVLVFPGAIPQWCQELTEQGVHCWNDSEGDSLATLGLWLRGGNWSFAGGPHAARPTLALLQAGQSSAKIWIESVNFRLPPSLQDNLAKISRLV